MAEDLDDILQNAFSKFELEMNICVPVEIVAYDREKIEATVKPAFDITLYDGTIIEALQIEEVPVCFPMSSKRALVWPLLPGDQGVCIFSQRSLDDWKKESRELTDLSLFQLSDAILIPGVTHPTMVGNHVKAVAIDAMVMNSDKIFIGDANQKGNPSLSSAGVKNRELVQLVAALAETLGKAAYGLGGTTVGSAATQTVTIGGSISPPDLLTIQTIAKELKELIP